MLYTVKLKITYILFFILVASGTVTAQVIDTTMRINAWKLMHNYSRFEDTEMDTTLFGLHQEFNPLYKYGDYYEQIGILGHAVQNLNFFERPGTTNFLFGSGMYPYLSTPDRTVFYNTRTPYTELIYSNMLGTQANEESVRFMHTQNMDPFSNIGIEFELLSGKEFYFNERSRASRITLFGNRTKDKYSAFGSFHYNSFNNEENGGLEEADSFLQNSLVDKRAYPVNLNYASSGYKNIQLFYTQKFTIDEKIVNTDTLGITTSTGRNLTFNHLIQIERNTRFYEDDVDQTSLPSIYDNFYYLHDEVKDSVVQDKIANTFQLILGDPYTDKLSARIYAGHEFMRYGQMTPDIYPYFTGYDTLSRDPLVMDSIFRDTITGSFENKYFNELFLGFHLAGPPENDWYWNIDGKYYVAGYYRNNFVINATFSRALTDSLRLGLRGGIENRNVSYYHNHYSSSFFQWNNDFQGSQIIKGEAFLTNPGRKFDASITLGMLTNYLYWDENALPVQYNPVMYIVSAVLNKRFTVSGFNSDHKILLQYTTSDDILHLPLASWKTSNYWEQNLFKDVLITQFGFDLYINTPYLGNAYMPATGVFYLQNDQEIGGYPFLDAFFSVRLKRFRLFVSYNNVLSGLVSNNYFTLSDYPIKPRYLRFGLAWTFYD